MPESPVDNPVILLPSRPRNESDAEEEFAETVAFLPPLVSRMLILGWILLFAGRWLIVQGMVAAGLLAPELVEKLDTLVLGRCYLALLSVTLVTLVVRIVRDRTSRPHSPAAKADLNPRGGPTSAVDETVEAESSDRGGKQA